MGIILAEITRYKKLGVVNISVALGISAVWCCGMPLFAQAYWPNLLQFLDSNKIDRELAFFVGGTAIQLFLLFTTNWWFEILYRLQIPFFEKYRIESDPWPWQSDPKAYRDLETKSIGLTLFNNTVITGALRVVVVNIIGMEQKQMWDTQDLPSISTFTFTMLFCMMCEDLMFSFSHRLLHTPWLYKHIHKIHHQHRITVGIASNYAHPVEFFLGNLLPSMLGPLVLDDKIHRMTMIAWFMVRTANTVEHHSGYEFPWSCLSIIPFSTDSEYHSFHHSRNVGNFSSFFSIWDTVFNSNHALQDSSETKIEKLEQQIEVFQNKLEKAKDTAYKEFKMKRQVALSKILPEDDTNTSLDDLVAKARQIKSE